MNEQDRKREYRARIQAETEKIRPEEVFGTLAYLNLMKSIAGELTDGRFRNVYLYSNPAESRLGWCDGRRVSINIGNSLTESFQTVPQKNVSLVGILGHECGHKNYSDFGLRKRYVKGFLEGIWYPHPPEAENPQEEQDLEQMRGYFERRDQDALALIVQVAAYLHNLLEDIYIEDKMCARFPGSVRRGILLNRERNVEWIPTLRTLLEEKEDPVSILMNLCAQCALSGRINNWDNGESEFLEIIKALMPVIRKACEDENSSARYLAANRIILKIWKYLYEIIHEMEKQREQQKKEQEEEQEEQQETEQGKQTEEGKDNSEAGEENASGEGKEENGRAPAGSRNGARRDGSDEKDGSGGKDFEQGDLKEASPAMREYLKHLAASIPRLTEEGAEQLIFRGFPEDTQWNGAWQMEVSGQQAVSEAQESGKEKTEGGMGKNEKKSPILIQIVDADGRLQEILRQMAKERVDAQINQEISLRLQEEMDDLAFESGHKKVKKVVCREHQITDYQKQQYEKYQEQVKTIQRRLISTFLPLLQDQGARTERQLFMGKRIDMRSIANPQGAIYRKHYPGKKVDIAVAVLIDMSDSMGGARIGQSKLAALCLYDFCRKAGIPVSVYGHHTDGCWHRRLEDETVYLHCCAEFEPDENDCYRIASLKTDGANRDGVALRFMGEKLLRRREKQKLLVLVSDGLPNSNQYKGKKAKEDLVAVKKNLTGRGITFLAAAIGTDKEKIREIYQESFLDISVIEKLPVTLTKQVIKQIRRY